MTQSYPKTIQTLNNLSKTGVTSVTYPAVALPNFEKHATSNRIKAVLGSQKTYAFTLGGVKYYQNGELKDGGEGVVAKVTPVGTVILDAVKLGELFGIQDLTAIRIMP